MGPWGWGSRGEGGGPEAPRSPPGAPRDPPVPAPGGVRPGPGSRGRRLPERGGSGIGPRLRPPSALGPGWEWGAKEEPLGCAPPPGWGYRCG